jgi:glycosyltransferase involved in cell wall biosynthesis
MDNIDSGEVCIVMPAYNAAKTIEKTFMDIPKKYRNNVIVVDDKSTDNTAEIAGQFAHRVIRHEINMGYGANQKTCYSAALETDASVIVMLHPDYQYDSRVIEAMVIIIRLGICDVVLGNRIRSRQEALDGGMPLWKYLVNRSSTFIENLLLGQTLGDFHSGFRAYSREALRNIPFQLNSNSFAFDQQFLMQAIFRGYRLGDVPVPVRYFDDSSSINIKESFLYGMSTVVMLIRFFLAKLNLRTDSLFK